MNISNFYKHFTLLNNIFYKDSANEVVKFLQSELIKVNTLDVGCGDGQLTLPLLDLDFNISGFDISEEMLINIKNKVKNKNAFIVKDALDFNEHDLGKFDQAYCMRTSFGNFDKTELNKKYLENIYKSLNKNAIFYLDYLNFNKLLKKFNSEITMKKDDYKLIRNSEIRNDYMHQTWTLYYKNVEQFSVKLGTYIYLLTNFSNILEDIGFKVETIFGNYNKESFNIETSDRLIYKLRK